VNRKLRIRLVLIILGLVLILGCSGCTKRTASANELKPGTKLKDIASEFKESITLSMEINEYALRTVFYVDPSWVEDYAGRYTIAIDSADNFIIAQCVEGHVQDVKYAFEKRKRDLVDGFFDVSSDEYMKALASQIVIRGNYVFFISLGEGTQDHKYNDDLEKAKEKVFSHFGDSEKN
jgi:hypothetical protein